MAIDFLNTHSGQAEGRQEDSSELGSKKETERETDLGRERESLVVDPDSPPVIHLSPARASFHQAA